MREKGRKYDTWSQKDIYIAAAITWLIKYNQRLWYINMNSRSVYPLLSDVIMNVLKMLHALARLHFCLIVVSVISNSFYFWRSTRNIHVWLQIVPLNQCISFCYERLERWFFFLYYPFFNNLFTSITISCSFYQWKVDKNICMLS